MIILTTISFLEALNGLKVDPERFKVNFNTFAVVVGPTGSGKSPTTNVHLKDPSESMEGYLGNYAMNPMSIKDWCIVLCEFRIPPDYAQGRDNSLAN